MRFCDVLKHSCRAILPSPRLLDVAHLRIANSHLSSEGKANAGFALFQSGVSALDGPVEHVRKGVLSVIRVLLASTSQFPHFKSQHLRTTLATLFSHLEISLTDPPQPQGAEHFVEAVLRVTLAVCLLDQIGQASPSHQPSIAAACFPCIYKNLPLCGAFALNDGEGSGNGPALVMMAADAIFQSTVQLAEVDTTEPVKLMRHVIIASSLRQEFVNTLLAIKLVILIVQAQNDVYDNAAKQQSSGIGVYGNVLNEPSLALHIFQALMGIARHRRCDRHGLHTVTKILGATLPAAGTALQIGIISELLPRPALPSMFETDDEPNSSSNVGKKRVSSLARVFTNAKIFCAVPWDKLHADTLNAIVPVIGPALVTACRSLLRQQRPNNVSNMVVFVATAISSLMFL